MLALSSPVLAGHESVYGGFTFHGKHGSITISSSFHNRQYNSHRGYNMHHERHKRPRINPRFHNHHNSYQHGYHIHGQNYGCGYGRQCGQAPSGHGVGIHSMKHHRN